MEMAGVDYRAWTEIGAKHENQRRGDFSMFKIIVVILLLSIVGLLFRINSKLPERDWVKEAMERDASK